MRFSPQFAPLGALALAASGLVAACSEPHAAPDTFEATGEIIALSGGEAGAANACVTCHGLQGQGDGNLVPRLAGLDAGYIARQLIFYDEGQRRHPQMSWIAGRLDAVDREKVSAYYSDLPWPMDEMHDATIVPEACSADIAQLYLTGDPNRDIPGCASCHGPDGMGDGAGNPPLAGQPAPYLEKQLEMWRSGERYGDPLGTMTRISRALDPAELRPLADYSAHLRDGRNRQGPPAACP